MPNLATKWHSQIFTFKIQVSTIEKNTEKGSSSNLKLTFHEGSDNKSHQEEDKIITLVNDDSMWPRMFVFFMEDVQIHQTRKDMNSAGTPQVATSCLLS